MRRYGAGQTIKSIAVFLTLLLLFPYIVSVFVNGADTGADDEPFSVRVRLQSTGEKSTLTEVGWNDYLAGILALELPEGCGEETAKALAVLIRTWLYREAGTNDGAVAEERFLTAEDMAERQGGEEGIKIFETYVRAAEETDDMVLKYKEAYAWTPYHQSSSGLTRDAEEVLGTDEFPYIAVRECPLDKEADEEIQKFTFSCAEIQKLCRDFLVAEENGETALKGYTAGDFEIVSRDSADYVKEIRIGSTICTGDQFRNALSLPSSNFTIDASSQGNQKVEITTVGKGHGLGMSVWTAGKMAEEGKTCEEILDFFFEGTELCKDLPENEIFQQ